MRTLFLIAIVLFCSKPLHSQFYQIFGPLDVVLCSAEPNLYFLESSEDLVNTIWTIVPAGSATIIPDLYFAEIRFFAPGTYTLIATSTTNNQVILTDSVTIYVFGIYDLPTILGCYEVDSLKGCNRVCAFSQTTISFPGGLANYEVIGAESYTYDSQSRLEITWGAGGPGSVTIFNQGCDISLCFEILPLPVADFSTTPFAIADTLIVCKFQDIYFDNNSQNGLQYTWNFGDGNIGNEFDAIHAYKDEGYYTVTLTAESICDCDAEKQIVIAVLPDPAPTLDCINSICPETRQRYTATTAGCTNYSWSISSNGTIVNGGGPTDDFIEVIWHEGPDGFIDLAVSGCSTTFCSFTNRFRVPIISPEGPIEGDLFVCSGEVTTYSAPYFPGTQYFWQVGPSGTILGDQNKNAVTVRWSDVNVATSTYVDVLYENCFLECGGHDVLNILITPEIQLQGDQQVCQNETASINATAGFISQLPANVNWQIIDADGQVIATGGPADNWTYTFAVPPGIYTWVALNSSGLYCTELAELDIEVTGTPPVPLSIIGETTICPGQPYGYTIESAGNYSTIWTITDGASTTNYTGQTSQHTFGPTPPYIVQAAHVDIQYMACASDPVSITLSSSADLTIEGPDEVCFNNIDTFSTTYISGAEYIWEIIPADHGEIRRGNLNHVEVFWTQSGPVTLRLLICGETIDKIIQVHALPVFNLVGPTAACANETVSLTTDQSTFPHVWIDENDIIIGIQNNINLLPGSYAVQLTDANGCVGDMPFQITSYPAPVVHLSSPFEKFFCDFIPAGVEITANTDGPDYQYAWFQDDVPLAAIGPVFTVSDFGKYQVAVVNQYGCTTLSDTIVYTNCCPPTPCNIPGGGGFPGGCVFIETDFLIDVNELSCNQHRLTPLLAGITPASTQWIIKSVSQGVLGVIVSDILDYEYDLPGYYQIETISQITGFPYGASVCGHIQYFVDTVKAVADFKFEGICAGSPIVFEDLTTFLPHETIESWSWDFGDPTSGGANVSTLQDPSHIFSAAGVYEVTLVVTLASGCSTTRKLQVNVSAGPILAPVYDAIYCEDEAMAFQLPGQAFDIIWNFGDVPSGIENTAGSDSVFHTYDLPGMYNVTVEASDIYNCRSQSTFPVEIIINVLSGLIDVNPITPLCAGDTAILTAPSGGVSWLWSNDETTSLIEVTESNQYNVLIRDQYNCTFSPPAVFVEVFPKPEVIIKAREVFGPNEYGPWSSSLELCYGSEFELTAFSSGNVLYHWTHGPIGPILHFTAEGANLPDVGTHEFVVTTIDMVSNCVSDSALILIEIIDLPQIPVISLVSGSACSFDDNVLQVNNPQAGITYQWSDGQTGLSITVNETGLYFVEAINDHGCISKSNSIQIQPSALVDQIPGGCFIECNPLTVCLPLIGDVTSYTIYKDGVVYQTGSVWQFDYLITMDGSYTIEVTTSNGCTATSDPLDVVLYPGTGSITVLTYFDTNGDGVISAGDALLPNIPVQINSLDGLYSGMTFTEMDGDFVFEDYPASTYTVSFNQNLLPSQWKIVIDSLQAEIMTCEDSIVVSLLLTDNCTVTGADQVYELCPGEMIVVGDSTWTEIGTYMMHMQSVQGCDSTFQVELIFPDSLVIGATVWVDVDHNGVVSAADTVIQGITILLDRMISIDPFIEITDINGTVSGMYQITNYQVYIDSTLLPPGLEVIYGIDFVYDTVCGQVTFNFLLGGNCSDIIFIQQEALCPGDSIQIEGQWITGAGVYNFILNSPGASCDSTLDVFVTMHPEMILDDSISWNCQQQGTIMVSVSGEGPFQFDWGNQLPSDSTITNLPPGDYGVIITDGNGCSITDTFTITGSEILDFYLDPYHEVIEGDSVEIFVEGDVDVPGLQFQWTPSAILNCDTCISVIATPLENTLLTVEITDEFGCIYNLSTEVIIFEDTISIVDQLYIPNVFSPNNDGFNDFWTMYSRLPEAFVHELTLFDRWGSLILHKSGFVLNTFNGWDGTFRGKPVNPGVFTYMGRLTLGDGKEVKVKGDITLLR